MHCATVPDVLVIGGGPAGLAAAIAARQRGFDVLVVDAAAPPVDKPCGEGLLPDSIAAARAIGLDLAADGRSFGGIRFVNAVSGVSVAADFPNGRALGVRRTVLHDRLRERAEEVGVRLAWRSRITRFDETGARWIIGADGGQSAVRRWAGLDGCLRNARRYGFVRHYRVAPWSDRLEVHWGEDSQVYVTPVAEFEVSIAVLSRHPHTRLEDTLPSFPEVSRRVAGAASGPERGGVTATRRLKRVTRGSVALVGDASGSVDAITGAGICLLFQQAAAIADALEAGDLSRYETAHRRIGRRARFMAELMLLLDGRHGLRELALSALAAFPAVFGRLVALHVGESLWRAA